MPSQRTGQIVHVHSPRCRERDGCVHEFLFLATSLKYLLHHEKPLFYLHTLN